jgi:hypothetical protein
VVRRRNGDTGAFPRGVSRRDVRDNTSAVVLDLYSESLVVTPRLLVRDNVDEQTAGSAWGSDQWCGGASW